ncbi:MAG: hypothetical protein JJU00_15785 [Opitutales bacterium]|nr:hypothetical protein [Opitutales bacterium]
MNYPPFPKHTRLPGRLALATALACTVATLAAEDRGWSVFHEAARALPVFERVGPGPNEVTMRTLEFRDVPAGSQMDPFQAVRDFHATRLEWTYIDFNERDRENIKRVRRMGVVFGGAGSASLHGSIRNFPQQPRDTHMLDLEGNPIVQPHMRAWDEFRGIGDPSNPAFYEHHLAYYRRIIDWGAETLHRDEPESPVFAAERYGGGFSETGVAGFREWLADNLDAAELASLGIEDVATFDYAEHLRAMGAPVGDDFARFDCPVKPHWVRYWEDTTTAFWSRFLAEIKDYSSKNLTFSANNSSLQMWESYHREFDFAISELLLETANPVHIWERSRIGREVGKVQVLGPPKTRAQPVSEAAKNRLLRRVVATAYACGMIGKVPWDVFDQSPDGKSRYFVEAADISDLYAFVRAHDWRDYGEGAAFGPGIEAEGPGVVRAEGGSGGVYGFVRAPVHGPERPVLVHLVDWGLPESQPEAPRHFRTPTGERIRMYPPAENIERTRPEPFTLVVDATAFDDPEGLVFRLRVPAAYDADAHALANATSRYESLVKETILTPERDGGDIRLRIPAPGPWGLLEISRQ